METYEFTSQWIVLLLQGNLTLERSSNWASIIMADIVLPAKSPMFLPFKGTSGYENKLIFIDCQWLVKTNCATFIFIGKLSKKKIAWPVLALPLFCLSFSALRHSPKSWFLIWWSKARASLLLRFEIVCWWGRTMRFEWVSSAVITVEDHDFNSKIIS